LGAGQNLVNTLKREPVGELDQENVMGIEAVQLFGVFPDIEVAVREIIAALP
jgi:hypothetical protein